MKLNEITDAIIGAAIEVHKHLGPGLLESAYEACLAYEIATRGLKVVRQMQLSVRYKEVHLDCGYRIDRLVQDRVVVELKVSVVNRSCQLSVDCQLSTLASSPKTRPIRSGHSPRAGLADGR